MSFLSDVVQAFVDGIWVRAARPGNLVAMLLLGGSVCPPLHAEFKKDIEYGQAAGQPLLLDAYSPDDGAGPFPVAILVHGGGWEHGDKSGSDIPGNPADISPWFETFSTAGFAWFSINYRLKPKHAWPAGFEDVLTAVRWIKRHASEFKGDASRIAIVGHSAGGNLAGLVVTNQTRDTEMQAAVLFAPAADFPWEKPIRPGHGLFPALQDLRRPPPGMPPEVLAAVRDPWPFDHVNSSMCPVLIVGGDVDLTVPYWRSTQLLNRLRSAGVACDRITIKGGPHSIVEGTKTDPSYRPKMITWLRQALAKSSRPPLIRPDVVVAADGSGDFPTVQAALRSIPAENRERKLISVKEGIYAGNIHIDRAGITLRGESRRRTRIESTGGGAVVQIDAQDCVIENLSIENLGEAGVNPALQLGTAADRTVVADCDLFSNGDGTLTLSNDRGRVYGARLNIRGGDAAIHASGAFFLADSVIYEQSPGAAAVIHAGGPNQTLVVRNGRFDGPEGWRLASAKNDGRTFLLGCQFARSLSDVPPASGNYFYDSHRYGGDPAWLADNFPTSVPALEITPRWAFGGTWDPERLDAPEVVQVIEHAREIVVRYAEPVTVKGRLKLVFASGRRADYVPEGSGTTLRFTMDAADSSGATLLAADSGVVIASMAGVALRPAECDLPGPRPH